MHAIKTDKLTKYYKNGKVLGIKDLDLEIEEGEIFGYIGPNGAGKSTTIRLLLDLIRPTSGTAKIFGLDIHKDTVKIKEAIGFLPGEIFLPENLTGKDCLSYYKGFKHKVEERYVKKLIDNLDLDLSKKISDYSKGNKQKLAIVLALMHKPRLLILDEPTSGLDPLNQQTFYSLIKETKSWGATTFFSTHILEEAEKLCDRVGIIKKGALINIEDIDQFRIKNIRDLHIRTKTNIPLSELKIEGVVKVETTTTGYHLAIVGEDAKILRQILKHDIEDIDIEKPTLEEIFLRFYK
jgi:ABC-2 type transport system ATP-binding protein